MDIRLNQSRWDWVDERMRNDSREGAWPGWGWAGGGEDQQNWESKGDMKSLKQTTTDRQWRAGGLGYNRFF